jgi:hypothetical protein
LARTITFTVDATPAWASGQAVNEWRELFGSSLSLAPKIAVSGNTWPTGKQDAWCSWCVDTRTSDIYSVGQGGHADYYGNEVDRIRLTDAAPAWTELVTSSIVANVTSSSNYYSDGKPASVHGYYGSFVVPSINRAVRMPAGARSIDGNFLNEITSYNLTTGAYDVSGTWSGTGLSGSLNSGQAYVMHPTTEAVYLWDRNFRLMRWTAGVPGTWATLNTSVPTAISRSNSGAACDTGRNCLFFLGGEFNVCHRYNIAANTFDAITLTGSNIAVNPGDWSTWSPGLVYVATTDRYYACLAGAGGSKVYVITPTTGTNWACSLLSTTGGSGIPANLVPSLGESSHPHQKFLYVPDLSGCVYGPRYSANLWFLKLH